MTERISQKQLKDIHAAEAEKTRGKKKKRSGADYRPDKPTVKRVEYEHLEQVAFIDWTKLQISSKRIPELDFLHSVPMGSYRSTRTAGMLYAEGAKPGVVDLMWDLPRGPYIGWKAELKAIRGNGKFEDPSDKQFEWMEFYRNQGFFSSWYVGSLELQTSIEAYYALGPYDPNSPGLEGKGIGRW